MARVILSSQHLKDMACPVWVETSAISLLHERNDYFPPKTWHPDLIILDQ